MKIRIVLYIVLQLALSLRCLAVKVETTDNLVIFYPEFSKIDLVCGKMPKTTEKDVEFCCEAAFTGELLIDFKHLNIADNHICNGEMKRGYKCRANTGGFVWRKNGWKFMKKADFPTTANDWKMGFCQLLIIKDGNVCPIGTKMKSNKNIYRALCEKNGRLCIIESKRVMTYEQFVSYLNAYKVQHALYLDMGRGWNYAWYRDNEGKVKERFPESKKATSYKYRTNWITFYK